MTYAGGRAILDADSHVMELADFLDDFIDPYRRDRLRRTRHGGARARPRRRRRQTAERRRRRRGRYAAKAEERLLQDKGWFAMGGFDPSERSRVLDLLGFHGQLVFATFATTMFSLQIHVPDSNELSRPRALRGRRAHRTRPWRASARRSRGCCPSRTSRSIDPARRGRCGRRGDRRRLRGGHGPLDRGRASARRPTPTSTAFWDVLSRTDVPFVLHVGGGGRLLDPAFHNNAMPVTDHLGGGENVRSKDYLAIHHSPELFLGVLILDGLFDRFPSFGADASSRARAGSCRGCATSTTPSGRSAAPRSRSGASPTSLPSTSGATSSSRRSRASPWAG